jgi:Tol biopolymer transport system component/DNA-binding winged helix-turn-helix (wHTH) protein
MSNPQRHFYEFDGFRVDVVERVLLREGEMVALTQKAFDVLLVLVERQGGIVGKDELMQQVWPDTFVEESNLSQNIYTLRKTLGKTSDGEAYIATVPRRGYRFAVPVREVREEIQPTAEVRRAEALPPVAETIDPTLPPVLLERRPTNWLRLAAVGGGALALVGGLLFWMLSRRPVTESVTGRITMTALTTAGNVTAAAISPDGKYVAYAATDKAGLHSLWLEEPATTSRRAILPPAEIRYHALTFSPDGSYVYYVADPGRTLYRVAALGGPPKLILERVGTAVAFSPDGQRMAFRRNLDERREVVLCIVNTEGGDLREVARFPYPQNMYDPAWSPDGQSIACGVGNPNAVADMYPTLIAVADGKAKRLTQQGWRFVGQMAWLANGRELLMAARPDAAQPRQLWRVNATSGAARPLTNDANTYNDVSLAARAGVLASLQVKQISNVWLMPANDPSRLRQITFGAGGYRGHLAWTPDNRLLYDSEAGNAAAISVMDADGGNQRLLSSNVTGRAYVNRATMTADGRYIVFASDLPSDLKDTRRHIWRMNADGTNPVQLTRGTGEGQPHCSPDGRWVVYTNFEHAGTDRPTLSKVSIDGGAATQLTRDFTSYPAVSPDGAVIACLYSTAPGTYPGHIALYPFAGGEPLRVFETDVLAAQNLRWTPDGRFITYLEEPATGASKLWLQPREGGAPRLLLTSEVEKFFGWDWSRDGKQLALVRGLWTTNVVLVKDF